jgi:hypothetical protein
MAVASLACASTSFAGDDGWYVMGAIGETTSNHGKSIRDNTLASIGRTGFSSSFNKPAVYNLDVGYQVNKNFAVEGGYIGSNSATYSASGGNLARPVNASTKISGWTVAAVGILPLTDQFSLLGKWGLAGIKESATVTGLGVPTSTNGTITDVTYGIGAKYDFTHAVFGRLDIDSYKIGNAASSNRGFVWMVGVGYRL